MVAHSKVVLCVLFSGMGEVAGGASNKPVVEHRGENETLHSGICESECLKLKDEGMESVDWPQYIQCMLSCKGPSQCLSKETWSKEKIKWCCENEKLGCSQDWYSVSDFPRGPPPANESIAGSRTRIFYQYEHAHDADALFDTCLQHGKDNLVAFNGIHMKFITRKNKTSQKCYFYQFTEDQRNHTMQKGRYEYRYPSKNPNRYVFDYKLVMLPVQGTAFRWARWVEEAANKSCVTKSTLQVSSHTLQVSSQIECQILCEEENGCQGISYSNSTGSCYRCDGDVLLSTDDGFGFYRKPATLTSQESQQQVA